MPYVLRSFGAPVFISSTQVTSTILSPHAMAPPNTPYRGTGGMLPIACPDVPYQINGTIIDTPLICTAPFLSTNMLLPVGVSFALLFLNPSLSTQTLLSLKAPVTMTFSLTDEKIVTGSILLAITKTGNFWYTLCTVNATITI